MKIEANWTKEDEDQAEIMADLHSEQMAMQCLEAALKRATEATCTCGTDFERKYLRVTHDWGNATCEKTKTENDVQALIEETGFDIVDVERRRNAAR